MRIHEIDLQSVLTPLRAWARLPAEARLAWCGQSSHGNVPGGTFGESETAMLADGLLETTPTGLRRVAEGARPLRTVLRAAQRCRVLEPEGESPLPAAHGPEAALREYLKETFRTVERKALLADPTFSHWDAASLLAERAASRNWVEPILETKTVRAWEHRRIREEWETDELWTPLLDAPAHRELVRITEAAIQAGGVVPVLQLLDKGPKKARAHRARAVQAGLRYLVLFPRLGTAMDPVLEVGIHPNVARHAARGKVPEPTPVDVAVEPSPAFLVADVTTVLLDAAQGDLRIKANGHELYVKTETRLREALVSIPPLAEQWAETTDGLRLAVALQTAIGLRFLQDDVEPSGRRRLRVSNQGRAWLSSDAKSRLRAVVDHLSGVEQEAGDDRLHVWSHPAAGRLAPAVAGHYRHVQGFSDQELITAVRDAIGSLPADRAIGLGAWLRHQVFENNPLVEGRRDGRARGGMRSSSWTSAEDQERAWRRILASVLAERLIPLGGLALAPPDGEGAEPFVALTSVGRYMIGRADDFDVPSPSPARARIVVQPNFDVVFLAPAPGAEVDLAPFAERVGHHVGTLFHLTRDAAMRASAAGMSADDAVARLTDAQGGPVPDNVERSLRGWFDRVRVARVARVLVVQCPDEATASRVEAAGGDDATRLGPRAVQVASAAVLRRIEKKVAKEGVVLETSRGGVEADSRPARRRPSRRHRW